MIQSNFSVAADGFPGRSICFGDYIIVGFIPHGLFVSHAVCVDIMCNLLQVASKLRGKSCKVVEIGSR